MKTIDLCRYKFVMKTLQIGGGGGELGSAVLWLLTFPGEKQPEFPLHCIVTRQLSNLNIMHGNCSCLNAAAGRSGG